jgi:hypothetical protein
MMFRMAKVVYVLLCSPRLMPVLWRSLWAFESSARQLILDIKSAVFILVSFILLT